MKRRRRKPAPFPPPRFAGITAIGCCSGCVAGICLISGRDYCAHPRNGGLQGTDMCSVEAVKRLEAVQKIIRKKPVR